MAWTTGLVSTRVPVNRESHLWNGLIEMDQLIHK